MLVLLTIIFYIKTKTDVKKANAKLFHGICKELDGENRWLNDILDEVKEKNMGIDRDAYLVYGFQADEDLSTKLDDDIVKLNNSELVLKYSGSLRYEDPPVSTFICIKKSIKTTYIHDQPEVINQQDLIAEKGWEDMLKVWAEQNGCSNLKIGWYLLICEG